MKMLPASSAAHLESQCKLPQSICPAGAIEGKVGEAWHGQHLLRTAGATACCMLAAMPPAVLDKTGCKLQELYSMLLIT
jgi:hypothetical protein